MALNFTHIFFTMVFIVCVSTTCYLAPFQTHKEAINSHQPRKNQSLVSTAIAAMKLILLCLGTVLSLASSFKTTTPSQRFSIHSGSLIQLRSMNMPVARHPHCDLPGDPSLILTTNVDLGDAKKDLLKTLSALVAASTGKPESYVGEFILL